MRLRSQKLEAPGVLSGGIVGYGTGLGLPIVMTSGFVRPEDEEAAFPLGVRGLVLKPNTVDELAPVLDRLLDCCR